MGCGFSAVVVFLGQVFFSLGSLSWGKSGIIVGKYNAYSIPIGIGLTDLNASLLMFLSQVSVLVQKE